MWTMLSSVTGRNGRLTLLGESHISLLVFSEVNCCETNPWKTSPFTNRVLWQHVLDECALHTLEAAVCSAVPVPEVPSRYPSCGPSTNYLLSFQFLQTFQNPNRT